MSVLWRSGSARVTEVRDALEEDLAYTSVLSALQTLEEKGYVRHEPEGRAYRYFPTVEAERAGGSALARVRDAIFQGSAERMFAQMVGGQEARPQRARANAAAARQATGRKAMIAWMLYTALVSAARRGRGDGGRIGRSAARRPTRWVWVGAMAVAMSLAALAPLRTPRAAPSIL